MTSQTLDVEARLKKEKAEWMAMKVKGTPYTHADLDKALNSVLHKGQHWKDEIEHSCPAKMHDVVSEAIRYICGSHAEFYKRNGRWRVYAEGYWQSVGM